MKKPSKLKEKTQFFGIFRILRCEKGGQKKPVLDAYLLKACSSVSVLVDWLNLASRAHNVLHPLSNRLWTRSVNSKQSAKGVAKRIWLRPDKTELHNSASGKKSISTGGGLSGSISSSLLPDVLVVTCGLIEMSALRASCSTPIANLRSNKKHG